MRNPTNKVKFIYMVHWFYYLFYHLLFQLHQQLVENATDNKNTRNLILN